MKLPVIRPWIETATAWLQAALSVAAEIPGELGRDGLVVSIGFSMKGASGLARAQGADFLELVWSSVRVDADAGALSFKTRRLVPPLEAFSDRRRAHWQRSIMERHGVERARPFVE
jgi:hypothetical protein